MKLEALQQRINEEPSEPPQAPEFIIWMPPNGAVIECPAGFDLVRAGAAASKAAVAYPGYNLAVYQLVGSAFAPRIEPPFVPRARAGDDDLATGCNPG